MMNQITPKLHLSTSGEMTDEDLVKRALDGDAAAFEVLVRRYNQTLFRAARGILENDAKAQEAVQEGYLQAFTHLTSFKHQSSFKTWLTRIIVNMAISYQRKFARFVSVADINDTSGHTPDTVEVIPVFTVPEETPDMNVSQLQLKAQLEQAIGQLPERYRSVFMLHEVDEMSLDETAFCLGISKAATKKRLTRAKDKLRHLLEAEHVAPSHEAFEFAGKRCDKVTSYVMHELYQRGITQFGRG